MQAAVSPAGMRIVRLLVGNPAKTVAELIDETGVTRTAVTEQLSELVGSGYVERDVQRLPGRGRPRHLYSATPAALGLISAKTQELVIPAMWEAVEEVGGEEVYDAVVDKVAERMAQHYNEQIKSDDPRERLRQFVRMLRDEGTVVEVHEHNGSIQLCKRSCPFSKLLEERRAICNVDDRLMRRVIGGSLRRVSCRHHGDPCCAYELEE